MAPVVPGFTTQPPRLEATIKAIADHGAAFMGANLMYLKGGTRDHFMEFLRREFPHMVDGYHTLYGSKYAPNPYRKEIGDVVAMLRKKYGVNGRDEDDEDEKENARPLMREAEQQMLRW